MKLRIYSILILLIFSSMTISDSKPAYLIYDKNGKSVKYDNLLREALKADVVLFGEYHNNPITHWLQLELTQDIYAEKNEKLILGAEFIESDNQLVLDEYLQDIIKIRNFEKECRLWDNYATDYKPLVEFAKEKKLPFIATNIPRRYASVVASKGLEALEKLPKDTKSYIAPLPIPFDENLPSYRQMMAMMQQGHGTGTGKMKALNFAQAQAIKDATMAHRIVENYTKNSIFLHFNGAFHSDNYEGIYWYLKTYKPKLNMVTISMVEQNDIQKLDKASEGKADFIICVPKNMTKTY